MKLSKEKTWAKCLEMWKWISKHIEDLEDLVDHSSTYKLVEFLKGVWLRDHGYGGKLRNGCFFCEYAESHEGYAYPGRCVNCPAQEIDPGFDCERDEINWGEMPVVFYNYLRRLDRKRKKARAR